MVSYNNKFLGYFLYKFGLISPKSNSWTTTCSHSEYEVEYTNEQDIQNNKG